MIEHDHEFCFSTLASDLWIGNRCGLNKLGLRSSSFLSFLHQLFQCCAAGSLGQQLKASANKYWSNRHEHWQHNRREQTYWPLLITVGLERKEVKNTDERKSDREGEGGRQTDICWTAEQEIRREKWIETIRAVNTSSGTEKESRTSPKWRQAQCTQGNLCGENDSLNPPC